MRPEEQVNAPSTGERIRAAREARGMSRPVLAGLVGRSSDWLKKIETGIRPLNSLELLVQMTRALGLDDVADLTGGEFAAPVRAWSTDVHHVVPGVRQALTRASFAVGEGDGPPAITPDELSRRVACLWRTWHRSDLQRSEVGAALPDLVLQAHASVRASDGARRRACRAAAGDLYRLVQRLLAHICEPELHALAVERGRAFSEEADTAQSIAEAAWSSSVALCAAGHHEDAAALADRAAAALVASQTDQPGPAVAATLGALQLEAAAAHSLAGNMGDAYRYLDAAAATADRMPRGAWHPPSAFDTSGVEIMAVIVAAGLRRDGEATALARRIDPAGSRSVVRRSRLLLEQAGLNARCRAFGDAVRMLDVAVRTSTEAVALIPWARTLADELVTEAPPSARADARRIASTIRSVR